VPTVEHGREPQQTATEILKEWKQATAQRRYVFVSGLRHDYNGAFQQISKSKFVVMWESPGNGTLEILPPPDPGPGAAPKTASDPGWKVEWERPSRWFWIDGMVVFVEETERRVWKCPINDLGWMQGL